MKQVTIGGKTLNIECNFLALSAYERITGNNAFDFDFVNTNRFTATLTMAYAMLLANNPVEQVGELNDFMASLKSMDETKELLQIVNEETVRFFHTEQGDTTGKAKKGKTGKNA